MHQKRRKITRIIAIIGIIAGIIASFIAIIVFLTGRSSIPSFFNKNDTVVRQKLCVALGSSMAMIGWSSSGAGRVVFEHSLGQLGFPSNQIRDLCKQYGFLDESAIANGLTYNGLQNAKEQLRASVLTRVSVMAGAQSASHIKFGYTLTQLLLLLRFWNELENESVSTMKDRVESLQESANDVSLPYELAQKIQAMDAAKLSNDVYRMAMIEDLEEILNLYDMEPDPFNK